MLSVATPSSQRLRLAASPRLNFLFSVLERLLEVV